MDKISNGQIVTELEALELNRNGQGPLVVPTNHLAITEQDTDDPVIEKERKLQKAEAASEGRYRGIWGYIRVFQISRVIAMLSLYLYLDQLDLHLAHQNRLKRERLRSAGRLTRTAVYGERLYAVRLWSFQLFRRALRRVVLGSSINRAKSQEKQAVWLKEKLITLGPTFIKMGQSMGTRADLLPLPFVTELGTLVDSVPAFPNHVAFATIEHELGRKLNDVYAEFE